MCIGCAGLGKHTQQMFVKRSDRENRLNIASSRGENRWIKGLTRLIKYARSTCGPSRQQKFRLTSMSITYGLKRNKTAYVLLSPSVLITRDARPANHQLRDIGSVRGSVSPATGNARTRFVRAHRREHIFPFRYQCETRLDTFSEHVSSNHINTKWFLARNKRNGFGM